MCVVCCILLCITTEHVDIEVLHVTALVKSRLTEPYIMYNTIERERFNESVTGLSLSKRMKKA